MPQMARHDYALPDYPNIRQKPGWIPAAFYDTFEMQFEFALKLVVGKFQRFKNLFDMR